MLNKIFPLIKTRVSLLVVSNDGCSIDVSAFVVSYLIHSLSGLDELFQNVRPVVSCSVVCLSETRFLFNPDGYQENSGHVFLWFTSNGNIETIRILPKIGIQTLNILACIKNCRCSVESMLQSRLELLNSL